MSAITLPVKAAVEGITDEAALRRLASHVGLEVDVVYVTNGKAAMEQRIAGYNLASRFSPWVVLVDLDNDATCAAELLNALVPVRVSQMTLRIVVRSLEAWLLADRGLAAFLRVPVSRLPTTPDAEARPKRTVVDLARQSRRPAVRADMVPRDGSGREVGPAYTSRVIEFIERRWDLDGAATRSESLRRCLTRLREIPR